MAPSRKFLRMQLALENLKILLRPVFEDELT